MKLKTKQLGEVLGVKECTIKDWRADNSYKKSKISAVDGKAMRYDLAKLQIWLAQTGRMEYAERLLAYMKNKPGKPKKAISQPKTKKEKEVKPEKLPDPPPPSKSLPKKAFDIFQATEDVGRLFQVTKNRLALKLNSGDPQITAETTSLSKFATEYRNMTQACIEIDKDLKKVVLTTDVEKWMGRIFSKVKTDMLSLPYSVADQLAGLTNPDEIAKLLRVKIEDALRHLASDIKEMKT